MAASTLSYPVPPSLFKKLPSSEKHSNLGALYSEVENVPYSDALPLELDLDFDLLLPLSLSLS